MLMKIRNPKGQSTLEYAILIVIIVGALITLQIYIKRGLQGRLKSATDDIVEQYSQSDAANYHRVHRVTTNKSDFVQAGVTYTELRADEISNTYMNIELNAENEYWGGN